MHLEELVGVRVNRHHDPSRRASSKKPLVALWQLHARRKAMLAKLAELYPSRFLLVGRRPLKVGIRADIMTLHPELHWRRSVGRSATIRVVTPTWRRRSRVQRGSTRLAMSRTR